MEVLPLTDDDKELVRAAADTIRRNYQRGRHHVAAALRCRSGKVVLGLHLDSPAIDICAEAVALGTAACQGETDYVSIVAVTLNANMETYIIPPCGLCRELLYSFCPDIAVIFADKGVFGKAAAKDLLPVAYRDCYCKDSLPVVPPGATARDNK